jgi:hypothetical protein
VSDVNFVHWPTDLLTPQSSPFDPRAFTRSGGRSLGGLSRFTRTDRGFWVGSYRGVIFRRGQQHDQARAWTRLRTDLGGQAGLVAVPVCSTRLWAAEGYDDFAPGLYPHDDDLPFDDDTPYSEGRIRIEMASFAPLSSTVVTLRLVDAPTAVGIRFSYQHAMYETGSLIEQTGADTFRVPVSPAIRQAIPADAWLEADRPTVLCRLASDTEMDIEFPGAGMPRPTVNFVEAVDIWNDLALEAA